ncbi:hypothetical protein F5148DRAFT_1201419 [Russula earlei]|uniref:Uncharacterized protein n=1 Tax=Russula earlei TaxID=71964 RepID=A0ACC0U904_9AGAM|nr:hypothetical protein F5148DRAFT_1201419 [Russula earlei]
MQRRYFAIFDTHVSVCAIRLSILLCASHSYSHVTRSRMDRAAIWTNRANKDIPRPRRRGRSLPFLPLSPQRDHLAEEDYVKLRFSK